MLKTHYRSPIDWTSKGLEESARTLDDWYAVAADASGDRPADSVIEALVRRPEHGADDRSVARAAQCGGFRRRARTRRVCSFASGLSVFLSETAAGWKSRKQQASGVDAQQVDRLIAHRAAARARKDFKESDRIRDELAAMGVAIKDGKDADGKPVTTWEIAR